MVVAREKKKRTRVHTASPQHNSERRKDQDEDQCKDIMTPSGVIGGEYNVGE